MKLLGKTVLITGAAKRIGRDIALTLGRAGASLVLHYNRSKAEAFELQQILRKSGVQSCLVQEGFSSSVSAQSSVSGFLKKVYREVPHIDVLVNNASIYYPIPFGKVTDREWDAFMHVNLKAPFFLSQAVGEEMFKRKQGKIINLIDWTAARPQADYLPYAISKAGLAAATRGLAAALAPHVQVLGVSPGAILPAVNTRPEHQQKAAERSLLKKYGHPSDIANTVKFLVEGTDFMTGTVVTVDGGAELA